MDNNFNNMNDIDLYINIYIFVQHTVEKVFAHELRWYNRKRRVFKGRVLSSFCLSVGLSVGNDSQNPGKSAESTEMTFVVVGWVGPGNHCIRCGSRFLTGRANLGKLGSARQRSGRM